MNIERRVETDADVPRQFVRSAFAFLAAAQSVTNSMLKGRFPSDVVHGDVVLWLAFHASELFCKGCILRKQPRASVHGHSLAKLLERLEALSPGVGFQPPFDVEIVPRSADSPGLRAEAHKRIHERLRYPTNSAGRRWTGVRAFSPDSFSSELIDLRRQMERVQSQLFASESGN